MLKIDEKNIQGWANKLMFRLDDNQVQKLMREFDVINRQMDLINEIKGIESVEPMVFPYVDYKAVLRSDDDSDEGEPIENLLSNAKEVSGREIRVPKVVE